MWSILVTKWVFNFSSESYSYIGLLTMLVGIFITSKMTLDLVIIHKFLQFFKIRVGVKCVSSVLLSLGFTRVL